MTLDGAGRASVPASAPLSAEISAHRVARLPVSASDNTKTVRGVSASPRSRARGVFHGRAVAQGSLRLRRHVGRLASPAAAPPHAQRDADLGDRGPGSGRFPGRAVGAAHAARTAVLGRVAAQRHSVSSSFGQMGGRKGEFPVMNYEWGVTQLLDSMPARLAVQNRTFEGGEMDLLRQQVNMWSAAGDPQTAALMDALLADEVHHVRYANRWLKQMARENPRTLLQVATGIQLLKKITAALAPQPGEVNAVGVNLTEFTHVEVTDEHGRPPPGRVHGSGARRAVAQGGIRLARCRTDRGGLSGVAAGSGRVFPAGAYGERSDIDRIAEPWWLAAPALLREVEQRGFVSRATAVYQLGDAVLHMDVDAPSLSQAFPRAATETARCGLAGARRSRRCAARCGAASIRRWSC